MLEFDIPVHGDNRGWFKENFKRRKSLYWASQRASSQKENYKIMFPSLAKTFFEVFTQSLGINTFQWQMAVRFWELGSIFVKAKPSAIPTKPLSMLQKVSLSHVALPTVSKFCQISWLTATWSTTTGLWNSSLSMPSSTTLTLASTSSGKT